MYAHGFFAESEMMKMIINKRSIFGWCDFTWDPVTGCKMECPFCSGRNRMSHFKGDIRYNMSDERILKDEAAGLFILTKPLSKNKSAIPAPTGFYPTLHPYRLPLAAKKWKPANINVCHSGELFGDWIPTEWILQVFEACEAAPWHNFLFLTKNPKRYRELDEAGLLPTSQNFWYGTRVSEPTEAYVSNRHHTFICVEPLNCFANRYTVPETDWIIIGGDENTKLKWIENILIQKGTIPLFMVDSKGLRKVWGNSLIQEWPAELIIPTDIPVPHCNKCQDCEKVPQGKRGFGHLCKHRDVMREDGNTKGRFVAGRFARQSPQWCPRRAMKNWRLK